MVKVTTDWVCVSVIQLELFSWSYDVVEIQLTLLPALVWVEVRCKAAMHQQVRYHWYLRGAICRHTWISHAARENAK